MDALYEDVTIERKLKDRKEEEKALNIALNKITGKWDYSKLESVIILNFLVLKSGA